MDALAAARRWAEAWKTGWEALDADRVLGLYAADAVHFTEPFRAPARGAREVRAYVERVFGEEEDPRVWVAEPIVDGERAAIAWWASVVEDGADITLAGVSVVRFDPMGLVVEQWDAWNQAGKRREPPLDSPFRHHDT